jgi:hypothetical protein
MVYVSSAHNDYVLSEVVPLMEVNHHVPVDLVDVVYVSQNGLAHHVLSVDVVIHVLHERLHEVFVGCQELLPDGLLLVLQVVVVVG